MIYMSEDCSNVSRGRPLIVEDGIRKSLTVTLSKSEWERIDSLIAEGRFTGKSQYFRRLHRFVFGSRKENKSNKEGTVEGNSSLMDGGAAVADQR